MSVIYKTSMTAISKYVPEKLQPLWKHPAGKWRNNNNNNDTY